MPAKIRLQRLGKRGNAYFHVVVTDSRKKRNGSYIEKIGTYNPNSNPATIAIDFDRALFWVKKGAEMTDTMRAMLSYRGILYKKHLDKGVAKGVLTQEQADAKFAKWNEQKSGTIEAKKTRLSKAAGEEQKKRMEAEVAVKETKAQKVQAKRAELAKAAEAAAAAKAAEEEAKAAAKAAEEAAKTAAATPVAETETAAEAAPAEEKPASETPQA